MIVSSTAPGRVPTAPKPVTPPANASGVVTFDGSVAGAPKGLTPEQVASSTDDVLKTTVANASKVMEFFQTNFGRNGLDGKGRNLELIVHAPDPQFGGPMANAYWDTQDNRMYVGDGDGRSYGPFGASLDVLAHEAGHAVLESEARMGFDGQQGALHESFGDVMGSLIDPADWQIGEDLIVSGKKVGFRDMENPARFKTMKDVTPDAEPHDLADIPNLAAVSVAKAIGRESMGKIWYDGFTKHLPDYAEFGEAAKATVKAASLLFGADSKQTTAVTDAWTAVGVLGAAAAAPAAPTPAAPKPTAPKPSAPKIAA